MLKVSMIVLFCLLYLFDTWLRLKVVKTAYIRSLPRRWRWFVVAPAWNWVVSAAGAACVSVVYWQSKVAVSHAVMAVVVLAAALSCYRGILIYTREHNLRYVQWRKRQQGQQVTLKDRIKDLSVAITPQRQER